MTFAATCVATLQRLTAPRWALLLVGGLLLLHSVYLAMVNVTHVGMLLPMVLAVAMMALALFMERWRAWLGARPWRLRVWRVGLVAFAVWLLTLLCYFAVLQGQGGPVDSAFEPALLVVLGSSTPYAKPSPALAERLKLAYQLAQQHPQAKVVVSGGVDYGEVASEARVMGDYLLALGLDPGRLLLEDRSRSTFENLVFSARIAQGHGMAQTAPMLLVSSDFHTLRASWIATKAGWTDVRTAGAPTPLYMRYNAWTREYFASVSGWLLREY